MQRHVAEHRPGNAGAVCIDTRASARPTGSMRHRRRRQVVVRRELFMVEAVLGWPARASKTLQDGHRMAAVPADKGRWRCVGRHAAAGSSVLGVSACAGVDLQQLARQCKAVLASCRWPASP
ncbi:MAG: hypothetical protein V9G23_03820 [Giesbergeria sp.]